MVEHLNGIEGASGSSPLSSIDGMLLAIACNLKDPDKEPPATLGDNDENGAGRLGKHIVYSDFTRQKLKQDFGLKVDEQHHMFAAVEPGG